MSVKGDGALTPAISVLSAIEGMTVVSTSLEKWVVPITILIIIILFVVQMFGTSKIGNEIFILEKIVLIYCFPS